MKSSWRSAAEGKAIRTPRSIVAVSGYPHRAELLDELLVDVSDYDVIVVESVARGYSRIKEKTPDLVVVVFDVEDLAACQLLSMLKLDASLAAIPVVTCATRRVDGEFDERIGEPFDDRPLPAYGLQGN
jgi:DNA-binding response OmpR family regulator